MDESSTTPTALIKIFGDFDSRVRTASKRKFEDLGRNPSGSSMAPTYKPVLNTLTKSSVQAAEVVRSRLKFEESAFESPTAQPKKRSSSVLADYLSGFERYPKAMKSDDTKNLQAENDRLKMQVFQKDAEIVALGAEVKQKKSLIKKMEIEVAKDRLLREHEREAQIAKAEPQKNEIKTWKNKLPW